MEEIKAKPNQEIIEMLEELIAQAKNGEINALACAGCTNTAETFNCFVVGDRVMALLGEITVLQRDFIDIHVSLRVPP